MLRSLQIFILIGVVVGSTLALTSPSLISSLINQVQLMTIRNHSEYDDLLKKWTTRYDIDCTLAKAMIYQENPSWDPLEMSHRGAVGLMQVLPTTAKLTQEQLFDPETNIKAGIVHLSALMKNACPDKAVSQCPNKRLGAPNCVLPRNRIALATSDSRFDDKYRFVLAAYNGGHCGANTASSGCPGIARWECEGELPETRNYVPRVLKYYTLLKEKKWGC